MGAMAELDMDRQSLDQITRSIPQRYAVAKLVGYCEGICSKDLLGEKIETELRKRIAETLSAFHMEPHQEAVTPEMERT